MTLDGTPCAPRRVSSRRCYERTGTAPARRASRSSSVTTALHGRVMSLASATAASALSAVAQRSTAAAVRAAGLRRGMAAARADAAASTRRRRHCSLCQRGGRACACPRCRRARRRSEPASLTPASSRLAGGPASSSRALLPPRYAASARLGAHRGRRRARCGPPASPRRPRPPGWRLHLPLRAAAASPSGAARRWALGCCCPRGGAWPRRLAVCGCRPAAVVQVVTRIRMRSASGATLAPMLAAAARRRCPRARRLPR